MARGWRARLATQFTQRPAAATALALLVGVGSGLGAVAFRYMILGLTELFTGHRDYGVARHAANHLLPGLGLWFVVAAPVIGGLIYGPLVSRFAPEARGHGVPEVMLAVTQLGGRMRPQVPVVKAIASAVCIGSGGSVGREGPIVQIGSALGSVVGQVARVDESRLRLLVACGAAGGIAATFNAPIAGVFFALELILRDFEAQSFGMVVLSSIVADVIGRAVFGAHAFLTLPAFKLSSPFEFLLYALLGVMAAAVGLAFIRTLYGGEDLADRIWRGPEWLRPVAGGVLLGLLLLGVPQMYGVGYPVLERAVAGHYVVLTLLLFLVAKVIATSLTISIGGSGGVFAPSLFMGAMLGSAYGSIVHRLLPHLAAAAGAYGLVGMGAVFAAAARAPITAVIIVFELTGDYTIILPLMFAIIVATALANRATTDTVYTLKLRRRGIDLNRPRAPDLLRQTPLAEAMGSLVEPLDAAVSTRDAMQHFAEAGQDTAPVVDPDGTLTGVVSAADVERAVSDGHGERSIGQIAHAVPELRADGSLEDAAVALGRTDGDGLPVLAPSGREVVGWITHRSLLTAYGRRLDGSSGTGAGRDRDRRAHV